MLTVESKFNLPIVEAMKSGRLPTLSQSRPAIMAMMKLKMFRIPFYHYLVRKYKNAHQNLLTIRS